LFFMFFFFGLLGRHPICWACQAPRTARHSHQQAPAARFSCQRNQPGSFRRVARSPSLSSPHEERSSVRTPASFLFPFTSMFYTGFLDGNAPANNDRVCDPPSARDQSLPCLRTTDPAASRGAHPRVFVFDGKTEGLTNWTHVPLDNVTPHSAGQTTRGVSSASPLFWEIKLAPFFHSPGWSPSRSP